MSVDDSNSLVLKNLEKFVFKEVLGGDIARKTIFLLLHHSTERKPAILICDKNPFSEENLQISELVLGAKLRHLATNDIYGNYEAILSDKFNYVKTTLIYPATDKHIEKYRREEVYLIQECPMDYEKITSVYINEGNFNLRWVYNFLQKKAEVERIVFSDENPQTGFVLGMDLKWSGENVDNLYLQAVVMRCDLRSVRDLSGAELPLLENIREKVGKFVVETYKLHPNQILMYFHYQPTYYHLHVHVINIKYEAPGHGPTSIFLDSVINNLRIDASYYKKAILPFFCKQSHPLCKTFHRAGRISDNAENRSIVMRLSENYDFDEDWRPPKLQLAQAAGGLFMGSLRAFLVRVSLCLHTSFTTNPYRLTKRWHEYALHAYVCSIFTGKKGRMESVGG